LFFNNLSICHIEGVGSRLSLLPLGSIVKLC